MNWYDKYTDIPYKYMGETLEGLDCYNLCRFVINQETNQLIPYSTKDCLPIADPDWYNKTTTRFIENKASEDVNWKKVTVPKPLDVIIMSLGSNNVTNHCALYVGNNKILHTTEGRRSYVTLYGNYYKQYTLGIYRWTPNLAN